MVFLTDKQTLNDLNLTGKYSKNSIFWLYNHTVTKGGERVLERMFSAPLQNASLINKRAAIFSLFDASGLPFPLSADLFRKAEDYLKNSHNSSFIVSLFNNIRREFMRLIARDKEMEMLKEGMEAALSVFVKLREFIDKLENFENSKNGGSSGDSVGNGYTNEKELIKKILDNKVITNLTEMSNDKFITFCKYDHLLRQTLSPEMGQLLKLIHNLDVYTSVASFAKERNFIYALADEPSDMNNKEKSTPGAFKIEMKGVYHPAIDGAVANDITIDSINNLFFLTGANMAGKSTLMKSFSIALYLAQMGFPVACSSMKFTVMEGLYTSINVPDNLNMGYSHFYAEVMRVKMIAWGVSQGKRLVVIFDEMFKGTNVKDAYDATVCVSQSFGCHKKCAFIISTHIMEAALALMDRTKGVQYKYLPTILESDTPRYPYTLSDGVSDDRYGMTIVRNEKIIDTIKNSPSYEKC